MTQKMFSLIAGILFALVALVHMYRIALAWPVMVSTVIVPMWVSWVGLAVTAILAYCGLYFGLRRN